MPTDPIPTEYDPVSAGYQDDNEYEYEGANIYEEDDEEDEDVAQDTLAPSASQAEPAPDMPLVAPSADDVLASAMTEPVIVMAKGLRKEFVASGDEVVRAVDDVSFTLTNRQFVTITGPSGCGKTTLLYILGSLEQPTAGSLVIDGVEVTALRGREADQFRRKSVGFVFQTFHLIPNLSAVENVMLPMEVAGVARAERHDRALRLLNQVGLPANRYTHRPGKLSGGQQQRVAIARALANDPAVILADEPTGNLDSANSKRLVSLLRELAKQGRIVIMVTHDRGIARLADLRMDLDDGRIVRIVTRDESENERILESASKQNKRN
ncbi:MAG TPA: ABC transporter ATP-binding protein, partial [Ktedonobacterales bacterium]|nr:ABC transporter ATP-binding protein [Ktedonobacterales bacterium]